MYEKFLPSSFSTAVPNGETFSRRERPKVPKFYFCNSNKGKTKIPANSQLQSKQVKTRALIGRFGIYAGKQSKQRFFIEYVKGVNGNLDTLNTI